VHNSNRPRQKCVLWWEEDDSVGDVFRVGGRATARQRETQRNGGWVGSSLRPEIGFIERSVTITVIIIDTRPSRPTCGRREEKLILDIDIQPRYCARKVSPKRVWILNKWDDGSDSVGDVYPS